MATKQKYDWPATEGLVVLVKKYGLFEAARWLEVPANALRHRLYSQGVRAKDYNQPKKMPDRALEEIRALLDS